MRMKFSTRSQTKISPTKWITYLRCFFIDRKVKKKQRALGMTLSTKVAILNVYYNTSKTITTHPNYGQN